MPQLELHNVPKWAGLPTGADTEHINSKASPLTSFKLLQKQGLQYTLCKDDLRWRYIENKQDIQNQ